MKKLILIAFALLPFLGIGQQVNLNLEDSISKSDSAWTTLIECSARSVSLEELDVILNWITSSDTSFTTNVNDWEYTLFMNTKEKNRVLVCKFHPTKTMNYEFKIYKNE